MEVHLLCRVSEGEGEFSDITFALYWAPRLTCPQRTLPSSPNPRTIDSGASSARRLSLYASPTRATATNRPNDMKMSIGAITVAPNCQVGDGGR